MRIIKSPFRMSLFGGGTDFKSFYSQHGSLLIGSTIDKYSYMMGRIRPSLLTSESSFSYSKLEIFKSLDEIENPLIREVLRYSNMECCVDFHHFTDIPHRTGLGGSSSFAVGLLYLIKKLKGEPIDRTILAQEAIYIEREILKEAGGIQDQIWASFGGLNSIEIHKDGRFLVKPLPITQDFKKVFEDSFVLIYTNSQRKTDDSAKSYDGKEKTHIKEVALQAYQAIINEDIKETGRLLYESWLSKTTISNHISSPKVDEIIKDVMSMKAYGSKLLGSGGGSGFICVMCDPIVKKKIIDKYKDSILEIKFDNEGVTEIYNGL